MRVERRPGLSCSEFVASYLMSSRPVVVDDAISRWPSAELTTAEFFPARFGNELVQVYDDLFELQDVCALQEYLDRYWWSKPEGGPVPYVRWYAKFKNQDFIWADAAFAVLAPHWHNPYFLPRTGYILPRAVPGKVTDPVRDAFPGKGIFISAAGGRTRLHRDPWCSDAVLCQLSGHKRVLMYGPQRPAEAEIDDILEAGEVLFIPCGWYHQVEVLTNSVSLTWNFVHAANIRRFQRYLGERHSADEEAVLAFFLGEPAHETGYD